MSFQTLHPSQAHSRLGESFQALGGERDEARSFDKIIDPERGRKTGGAAGGQDVIGAGNIVSDCFRGQMTKENRPGVFNFPEKRKGIVNGKLQVFGGEAI